MCCRSLQKMMQQANIEKWGRINQSNSLTQQVCEKLGPSLYDFLQKTGYHPFPIDLVRRIGEQLLESVAFMHRLQLIHTNLKPENILLVSSDYVKLPEPKDGSFSRKLPKSSAIKLINFCSTAYHHQDRSYIVSTRQYRAPEVILGHGWSYPCGIWSVGCILVELSSGEALFQTHENLEMSRSPCREVHQKRKIELARRSNSSNNNKTFSPK